MKQASTRVARILLLAACALAAAMPAWADLAEAKKTGVLKVAVYKGMPPFSDNGAGIDVDIANALAGKLGLKMSLLPFDAGEEVNDDLRNMVWKGHYLGYGPADVMMHVPVDRRLMEDNKRVEIFAPYYRDRVRLVRDVRKVPQCDGIDCIAGKPVGVEKVSIAAMLLLGEGEGRYRNDVRIFEHATDAMEKLRAGELAAVLATQSEIESGMKGDANLAMSDVRFARLPGQGWVAGLAVKKENLELAKALQAAMNDLVESGELAAIFRKYGVNPVKP
ncbi:substrate-binding periplasmic protein [Noviherbaspirillum galbum]|uniref:Amino acid ABC transporter substrate-binding protein n=1 Tax=Noviherbaspirillum galbum TaxID=2709383 RepID=A0A6B3SSZ9_9BURK|nr:transporter substrate-binding domain-containing protein [Noviherbaspirillum galbum]NEX63893.1 amino acid ABC transporter substrate-binding protein [Noviherbaspirillum galbum]